MLPANDFGLIFRFLLLPLSQAHSGAATVLVDELHACAQECQAVVKAGGSSRHARAGLAPRQPAS